MTKKKATPLPAHLERQAYRQAAADIKYLVDDLADRVANGELSALTVTWSMAKGLGCNLWARKGGDLRDVVDIGRNPLEQPPSRKKAE